MKFIKESAEGKDVETLYHLGPLEPETTELIPSLLRLHDYGLLTMGSQPAEETVIEREGKWFQLSQIPFLDFVVPFRDGTEEFLRDLVADEQLKCTITDFRSDTPSIFPGSGCDIVVTREKVECESRESLEQAEWRDYTSIRSVPMYYGDLHLDETCFCDPVAQCMVTTLNDVDLFGRIESHAARYQQVFFPKLTPGLESV
ncbi:hypothetical protein F4821DRAFT_58761 [Hypoxylon rubiginosum]|uniref:Uncharacterized protein n=1 Tax=Hypoxylon rubiginosum TaxID=110542 RepID=A0ACC0CJF1_9PEZI|nr:hypothetical protein F4821DRAFT_58761 [Hypoxylon rubiginosum]